MEFYRTQLELMWQAAEKATEARKALKRSSEDIQGPAWVVKARTLWYNSWVTLVNLLDHEEGVPLMSAGAQ